MGELKLENLGIQIFDLKQFSIANGDVMHALKQSETQGFNFSEIYFSFINNGSVKAWKRHREMTLNLIVPIGKIRFVFQNNKAIHKEKFATIELSKDNYKRVMVPSDIWFGFKGLEEENMLVNIASHEHDPGEVEIADHNAFNYIW